MTAPGIELIKEFEGFRDTAYPDPAMGWKLPTIGYGTTRYPDGSPVKKGDKISKEDATQALSIWVGERIIPRLSRIPTWARMNVNQRGALICFAYNLGERFYGRPGFLSITAVCDSPQLWDNRAWVRMQFIKYRNPGTNVESGLMRRREAESALFCEAIKHA